MTPHSLRRPYAFTPQRDRADKTDRRLRPLRRERRLSITNDLLATRAMKQSNDGPAGHRLMM